MSSVFKEEDNSATAIAAERDASSAREQKWRDGGIRRGENEAYSEKREGLRMERRSEALWLWSSEAGEIG